MTTKHRKDTADPHVKFEPFLPPLCSNKTSHPASPEAHKAPANNSISRQIMNFHFFEENFEKME
jgi:hypothetical protein